MGLADGRAEHSQALAGEKSDPTADPIPRIKRANHARAGPHAVLIQAPRLRIERQSPAPRRKNRRAWDRRRSRWFQTPVRARGREILPPAASRKSSGVVKMSPKILRAADALRINAVFAQFAREELLMFRGVTHNLDETNPSESSESPRGERVCPSGPAPARNRRSQCVQRVCGLD